MKIIKNILTAIVYFILCSFTTSVGENNEKLINVGKSAPFFHLVDQYDNEFSLWKNRGSIIVLFIGDHSVKEELSEWGKSIKNKYEEKIEYIYIISMPNVPFFLKEWIVGRFKGENEDTGKSKGSVFLDWDGVIFEMYSSIEKSANIILIDEAGIIRGIEKGEITHERKEILFKSIENILSNNTKTN